MTSLHLMRESFAAGEDAAYENVDRSANPMPRGTGARKAWFQGWDKGAGELEPDDDRARQGLGLPTDSEREF